MALFTTADEVAKGQYFWQALVAGWRLPFDLAKSGGTLLPHGNDVGIVVIKQQLDDGEERWIVQFKGLPADNVLLEASLTGDMSFIHASASGMALDEVGAVDTLRLYIPVVHGEWQQHCSPPNPLEDEQDV